MPVSPSGSRFRCGPVAAARVRNTVSASGNGISAVATLVAEVAWGRIRPVILCPLASRIRLLADRRLRSLGWTIPRSAQAQ